jgi:hypothetical protein
MIKEQIKKGATAAAAGGMPQFDTVFVHATAFDADGKHPLGTKLPLARKSVIGQRYVITRGAGK